MAIGSKRNGTCWLTSVSDVGNEAAEQRVKRLVGDYGIFAFGERTHARKTIAVGDWICFYARAKGIVAHARVGSEVRKLPDYRLESPERYPYTVTLVDACVYTNRPVPLDDETRKQLDALTGHISSSNWGWLVRSTKQISERDFRRLTRFPPKTL